MIMAYLKIVLGEMLDDLWHVLCMFFLFANCSPRSYRLSAGVTYLNQISLPSSIACLGDG